MQCTLQADTAILKLHSSAAGTACNALKVFGHYTYTAFCTIQTAHYTLHNIDTAFSCTLQSMELHEMYCNAANTVSCMQGTAAMQHCTINCM